jgi:hypothetical protein
VHVFPITQALPSSLASHTPHFLLLFPIRQAFPTYLRTSYCTFSAALAHYASLPYLFTHFILHIFCTTCLYFTQHFLFRQALPTYLRTSYYTFYAFHSLNFTHHLPNTQAFPIDLRTSYPIFSALHRSLGNLYLPIYAPHTPHFMQHLLIFYAPSPFYACLTYILTHFIVNILCNTYPTLRVFIVY